MSTQDARLDDLVLEDVQVPLYNEKVLRKIFNRDTKISDNHCHVSKLNSPIPGPLGQFGRDGATAVSANCASGRTLASGSIRSLKLSKPAPQNTRWWPD